MRPRHEASENPSTRSSAPARPAGFNEAEARGLGKRVFMVMVIHGAVRFNEAEARGLGKPTCTAPPPPGMPCFNEAEARGLGKQRERDDDTRQHRGLQ